MSAQHIPKAPSFDLPPGYTADAAAWQDPQFTDEHSPRTYVPTSESLTEVQRTFAGGAVRQYWDPRPGTVGEVVKRTEIDLPDGRQVRVHRHSPAPGTMSVPVYDRIIVTQGDEQLGGVALEAGSPYYRAYVNGEEIEITSPIAPQGSRELDLSIADALLKRALTKESGSSSFLAYGDASTIGDVVAAMKPGWTREDIAPFLKVDSPAPQYSETGPPHRSVGTEGVPEERRRGIGARVSSLLSKLR